MSQLASSVLAQAAAAEALLASTTVTKPLQLELDLGNLLAIDPNQFEFNEDQVWLEIMDSVHPVLPRCPPRRS